jgi:hypothetical protein
VDEEEEERRRLEWEGESRLRGIGQVFETVGMMTTFAFSFVKSIEESSKELKHVSISQ